MRFLRNTRDVRLWNIGKSEFVDYETLLRVPGIGAKTGRRIIETRRIRSLKFDNLRTMGGNPQTGPLLYYVM